MHYRSKAGTGFGIAAQRKQGAGVIQLHQDEEPMVIVAHNHPSGEPEPSAADQTLTDTLKSALSLVDVRVLDHIIVAGTRTLSFAELVLI